MRVRDLIASADCEPIQAAGEISVAEAVRMLARSGREALAVLSGGRFGGVFGPRELLNCCSRGRVENLDRKPVAEAADPNPVTAGMDEDIGVVLARACQARTCRVPVLEGGRAVAVMHTLDLARAHLDTLNAEVGHLQDYIADLHDAPVD